MAIRESSWSLGVPLQNLSPSWDFFRFLKYGVCTGWSVFCLTVNVEHILFPVEDLHVLAEAGAWLDYQGLRHLAEFKAGSIAVHWRGFSQEDAAAISEKVRKGWNRLVVSARMRLLDFDGGIEIRVEGRNKAHAVLTILEEIGPGIPLAYLGDDRTDEDAFSALRNCPQTLTILVRPEWRATKAKAWIKPPEQLLEFFDRWLECSGGAR